MPFNSISDLFPSLYAMAKNLTVNSMEGLRSSHNGSRGLMNINE